MCAKLCACLYVYANECVSVCVCVRERERERGEGFLFCYMDQQYLKQKFLEARSFNDLFVFQIWRRVALKKSI